MCIRSEAVTEPAVKNAVSLVEKYYVSQEHIASAFKVEE
jgi:hypothetical protein